MVHVHHYVVDVLVVVVQVVDQIVQNHAAIVVEIVQHHVQQLVEEVVLFHVVITVPEDVLVRVLMDVMDVLVVVEDAQVVAQIHV